MTRHDLDDKLDEIISEYKDGLTLKELSEKHGASIKTIHKRIRNGLTIDEIKELGYIHRKSIINKSINRGKHRPVSGYYRVYIQKARTKKGFIYVYELPDGKRFSSVDIDKLKERVQHAGHEWKEY